MKEIKAFVHRNRAADVIHALRDAGFGHLSVVDVLGMLRALDPREARYSTELGERVTAAVKLELVCEESRVEEAVRLIRRHARTGQRPSGWVYVYDVAAVHPIDDGGT